MDEIDIKRALRGYVTADAPPFPVTASDLLAQGRRRQLRRNGLVSLGSAGMAGVIVFFASAALTPRFGSDLLAPLPPVLRVEGCDQPLPLARKPLFVPTKEAPTAEPSPHATSFEPTPYPHQEPSSHPTELASLLPIKFASAQPTQVVSELPSDQPVETPRWPSNPPTGPLPDDPDPAKVEAMACYVRGAALVLFPSASFAPASEPPMQMIRWSQLDFETGWQSVYNVRAMVVEGPRRGMFLVQVYPLPRATQTPYLPDVEVRPLGDGRTAYIDRGYPGSVRVTTQRSSILVVSEGGLTVDESLALALAPELDLFS